MFTNVTGYFGGLQVNFPEPCAENEDDFIRECQRLHIFRAEFRSYTVTKTRCLISFRSLNVPGLNCLWCGKGFCYLPGLVHAQYCIISTAMETSSGVSVRENETSRRHRMISVMFLSRAWVYPGEHCYKPMHAGREPVIQRYPFNTCHFTSGLLALKYIVMF